MKNPELLEAAEVIHESLGNQNRERLWERFFFLFLLSFSYSLAFDFYLLREIQCLLIFYSFID